MLQQKKVLFSDVKSNVDKLGGLQQLLVRAHFIRSWVEPSWSVVKLIKSNCHH